MLGVGTFETLKSVLAEFPNITPPPNLNIRLPSYAAWGSGDSRLPRALRH
ncbi:MAG: hypothetical protein DHS20C05_04250 [Hyphococcus sp.]|nr:MAG: hypothetical protein DHS20C05_04250 [Marinicaulis sp.]